ncbi:MAG: RHS domain-containing protein [Candidatus Omnitrophica bacterium]|nr:RHS domain-containing protein [Candidatus Omnitrophota bacterium]
MKRYAHGAGIDEPLQLIAHSSSLMEKYYYQTDGLGSITSLIDENGNIVERYEYDAFGNTTIEDAAGYKLQASGIGNSYGFTGREYDDETGLYYYRARYYDPQIGRFLQEDPVWDTNLYSYVDNNPVNFVDPYGLQSAVPNIFGPNFGHLGTETSLVNIPWLDIAKNINRESGIETCGIGASIGLELGVGKSFKKKGKRLEWGKKGSPENPIQFEKPPPGGRDWQYEGHPSRKQKAGYIFMKLLEVFSEIFGPKT